MKKTIGFIGIAAMLALSGCSGETEQSEAGDLSVCTDAAIASQKAFISIFSKLENSTDEIRADYDKLALSTSGELKDRLANVVESVPNKIEQLNMDPSEYNKAVSGLSRACKSLGYTKDDIKTY